MAKVLDQLALSAWLPSAALVLLLLFELQLAKVLNADPGPSDPLDVIPQALQNMAAASVGEAVILIVAIVVLTMLTQAFSFEAIRFLEGYWGTFPLNEWLADLATSYQRFRLKCLERRRRSLGRRRWREVSLALERRSDAPDLTRKQRMLLQQEVSMVMAEADLSDLKPVQRAAVEAIDWSRWLSVRCRRRESNLDEAFKDYPEDQSLLMPTKAGNILKRYETLTGVGEVRSLVQRRFDHLPPSTKIEHDDQRTRLDLYASMIGVVACSTLVGAALLMRHELYALGVVIVGALGILAINRAVIATARAYGGLLLIIAELPPGSATDPASSQRPGGSGTSGAAQ